VSRRITKILDVGGRLKMGVFLPVLKISDHSFHKLVVTEYQIVVHRKLRRDSIRSISFWWDSDILERHEIAQEDAENWFCTASRSDSIEIRAAGIQKAFGDGSSAITELESEILSLESTSWRHIRDSGQDWH
jgi:hypothetical protein